MADEYKPIGHPIIPPPTWKQVLREAKRSGITPEKALMRLDRKIKDAIEAEEHDPLRSGWEPPIWKVCDALLGFEFCDKPFEREIQARFGWTWPEWSKRIREFLGFMQEVVFLLIMGANRSSKSEYSAKRGQLILNNKPNSNVYAFHLSYKRSVKEQQTLFRKYLPPEQCVDTATANEYIKYKRKRGFSDQSFINPLGSECGFLNYMQDRDTALEGMEADLVLPDELVPPDWIETMMYRLSTRKGKGIVTFTPIHGYTPTVKIFCDSAKIVRQSVGFMLPRDGGKQDPARALGLSQVNYEEIMEADAARPRRAAHAPQCVPEDCSAWLEERMPQRHEDTKAHEGIVRPFGYGKSQPEVPAGRKFEMMPRVLRPVNPQYAVVFFHPCDNPYGNTKDIMVKAAKKGTTEIRVRVYGKAEKTISHIFVKFSTRIHCVKPRMIPKKGMRYMFMDPGGGDRNYFLTWIIADDEGAYAHREWPGDYEIPGIGIPDPWAVPSGKKEGINDGTRGRGQHSFGFGLSRYKFEIARLERWEDWKKWLRDVTFTGNEAERLKAVLSGELYPVDEDLDNWDERNGGEEVMEARCVDSRPASTHRVERDRPVTLYEELLDLGMYFDLATGASVGDGIGKINTALGYERDPETGAITNKPHFFVSEECKNTIYALENWMNVDGTKAACGDPIANLRYYFTGEYGFEAAGAREPRGGFYYGRGVRRIAPEGGKKYTRRPACMDRKATYEVAR